MLSARIVQPRSRWSGSARVATALLLMASMASPQAIAREACTNPPDIVPVDELHRGVTGTALTVVEGRTVESIGVEVLGVQPDGVAPGVDFVLVKLSGPVIDRTGGIAAGMSGSPVTFQGRLGGALAFGFGSADQTIAGMTPAQPMLDLFSYPRGDAPLPRNDYVQLSPRLRRAAARAGDEGAPKDYSTAGRISLPVGISGLREERMAQVNEAFAREALPMFAYRAGSGPAQQAQAASPLGPGDSLSAAASYGTITLFGTGTATAVCDDMVVGFGHPMFFEGQVANGMNGADVVTTVPDPSSQFGAFKIANIAELHGVVDQDRLAGIRGLEGAPISPIPITSSTENPDLSRERDGLTSVVSQELVPSLASLHLLVMQDVTFDEIGGGSLDLAWTVRGIDESGQPFEFTRDNIFFSDFDISADGIFELDSMLFSINSLAGVTITGLEATETITSRELRANITRIESATGNKALRERGRLEVRPGDRIRLRVHLQPVEGGPEEAVDLALRVPKRVEGSGTLLVRGGFSGFGEGFFFFEELEGELPPEFGPAPGEGSLQDVLAQLAGTEHNSDVVATLGGKRFPVEVSQVAPHDQIVLGQHEISIKVVRKGPKR